MKWMSNGAPNKVLRQQTMAPGHDAPACAARPLARSVAEGIVGTAGTQSAISDQQAELTADG
jgi:hypothetical protein